MEWKSGKTKRAERTAHHYISLERRKRIGSSSKAEEQTKKGGLRAVDFIRVNGAIYKEYCQILIEKL